MAKHIIIYIPGLGDHNLGGQQKALKLWQIYGVQTEICPMDWLVDEPWSVKLQRLLDRVDYHSQRGSIVSLVGISAGSTAALQALEKRRKLIHKAVIICGKFQYPETVHPLRFVMNPAFKNALNESVNILRNLTPEDKQKIKSFRAIYDNLLPSRETQIPGVRSSIMPAITHVGGIAYALTLGSWRIVRFLKMP
jgi:pimeloyl-ACP methyl ester carboxylesterase